jgi:homoserine dehydrogenase
VLSDSTYVATVLGGLPLFNVFRDCMPVAQVLSFKGIINSTTNIILSRMETENESFEQVRHVSGLIR